MAPVRPPPQTFPDVHRLVTVAVISAIGPPGELTGGVSMVQTLVLEQFTLRALAVAPKPKLKVNVVAPGLKLPPVTVRRVPPVPGPLLGDIDPYGSGS